MFIYKRLQNVPRVTITGSSKSPQVRIAFNAPLVRLAAMQDVPYIVIDFDEEKRRVRFISTSDQWYKKKVVAFPVIRDGSGPGTLGRALYGRKSILDTLNLQVPCYFEPEINPGKDGPEISIALGGIQVSKKASSATSSTTEEAAE